VIPENEEMLWWTFTGFTTKPATKVQLSSTGELPDYLPLVLEYLSLNRNGDHSSHVALAGLIRQKEGTSTTSLLGQYCGEVETISSGLQEAGSVYAGLLAIVTDLFIEMKSMGV
jgi:nitrate reductase assembly molybdenum cofactor insertion protein NarJ